MRRLVEEGRAIRPGLPPPTPSAAAAPAPPARARARVGLERLNAAARRFSPRRLSASRASRAINCLRAAARRADGSRKRARVPALRWIVASSACAPQDADAWAASEAPHDGRAGRLARRASAAANGARAPRDGAGLVQARELPLAPAPHCARPAALRATAGERFSAFCLANCPGASFVVLLVPVPVPVPARGPRVSPHAGPRLLHSSYAPFLSRVVAAEQAAVCSAAMHTRLMLRTTDARYAAKCVILCS